MSIIVKRNGVRVNGIIWTGESRWQADPIYVYHEIKGATKGVIFTQGANSRKATITGRCLRNATNEATLNSLETNVNDTISIESSRSGTHSDVVITGIATNDDNPAWFFIRMSVMER